MGPLTLTLSPREREPPECVRDIICGLAFLPLFSGEEQLECGLALLPLPWGEGRGEGVTV